jgi:hypothetical protein
MQIQTWICNTGMYCEKSHQGGSVHLWSATHSANSGALSGLAARLAAVLAARLAAVLAGLVAGLAARLVASGRPHILICTAVRLTAKKIQNIPVESRTGILHLATYKAARMKKNLMRLQLK